MSQTDTDLMSDQDRQFATLRREIAVASREQGDDPEANYRLRVAMRRAGEVNMPDEMIERAREQGRGDASGPRYEEKVFEGYGSDGVAVLVETITDDATRTASELESLFEAHGGNLGDDGCVAWQFERRGVVEVVADEVDDPDVFMLEVIQMGGEEMREPLPSARDSTYRVYCDPTDVGDLDRAMGEAGYPVYNAAIVYEPNQRVPLELDAARKFMGFLESLAERPDVQHTYSNWRSV